MTQRQRTAAYAIASYASFIVLASLSVLVYLNRTSRTTSLWNRLPVQEIRPDGGYAYIARTGRPNLSAHERPSPARLLENGVLLSDLPNALHADIRTLGKGRYSFWHDYVYFAASDNSDPRTNGRRYELSYPTTMHRWTAQILYGLTTLAGLSAIYFSAAVLWRIRRAPPPRGLIASSRLVRLPKHSFWQNPASVAAVSTLAVLLVLLSSLAAWSRAPFSGSLFRTSPLNGVAAEVGNSYIASTGHPEVSSHRRPSFAQVLEDGRPLPGPASALHDDIRQIGRGRYSFWHGHVYFSTSDNSDPRVNGRSYTIRYPFVVGDPLAYTLYAATLLLLGLLFRASRNTHVKELNPIRGILDRAVSHFCRAPFWGPASVLALFFLSRAPFFLYYPVVGIHPDTGSYLEPFRATNAWPVFNMRTPGYPLFVHLATRISDRWLFVILLQTLLTLIACCSLLYAIHRLMRGLAYPAAVALGAYLANSQVLIYDTAALSESLYTSCTLFALALLFLALAMQRRRLIYILASSSMAVVILVRPAGAYLIVIYLLVLAFLALNRTPRIHLLSFLFPFPAVLLAACLYNYLTLRSFTVSPWGEANLAHATILSWQPDASLPTSVNSALADLPSVLARTVSFTDSDRQILNSSWDPFAIGKVFEKGFTGLLFSYTLGDVFAPRPAEPSASSLEIYLTKRALIRSICSQAIHKRPLIYFKFVISNVVAYFSNINNRYDFYSTIATNATLIYLPHASPSPNNLWYTTVLAKEYAHSKPPQKIKITGPAGDQRIEIQGTVVQSVHSAWELLNAGLFNNGIWILAYVVVLIASAVQLIRCEGRHLGAFVLFVLSLCPLGACLVVSLVELAIDRYSYPTQFAYYLAVTAAPLLRLRRV
jgi:hypothetical protein